VVRNSDARSRVGGIQLEDASAGSEVPEPQDWIVVAGGHGGSTVRKDADTLDVPLVGMRHFCSFSSRVEIEDVKLVPAAGYDRVHQCRDPDCVYPMTHSADPL